MPIGSVPKGLPDGSLARSAWNNGRRVPSRRERCEWRLYRNLHLMDRALSVCESGAMPQTVPSGTNAA